MRAEANDTRRREAVAHMMRSSITAFVARSTARCLFCGKRAEVGGSFAPSNPEECGIPKGKGRVFLLKFCLRCYKAMKPGEVDDWLAANHDLAPFLPSVLRR